MEKTNIVSIQATEYPTRRGAKFSHRKQCRASYVRCLKFEQLLLKLIFVFTTVS